MRWYPVQINLSNGTDAGDDLANTEFRFGASTLKIHYGHHASK
jgi:hypothetical protein